MYLVSIAFMGTWLFRSQPLKIQSLFGKEVVLILFFIVAALFNTIIRGNSLVDGAFVIFTRIAPLMILGFAIHYAMSSENDWSPNIRLFKQICLGFLCLTITAGAFQHFVQGKSIDFLQALQGTAHGFGFFALFLSYFFWRMETRRSYKVLYGLFFVFCAYLAYQADYKLGILSFILAHFMLTFLRFGKVVKSVLIGLAVTAILLSDLYMEPLTEVLPPLYSGILKVLFLESFWDLNGTFPPNLELFKGYMQLFDGVFQNIWDFLFGVGPGNYASNVAMSKGKHFASEFVIHYRELLDKKGVEDGTLLIRINSTINLIAEFGVLGATIYLFSIIRLLLFFYRHEKILAPNPDKKMRSLIYLLNLFGLFILANLPFFGSIEEGIYVGSISLFCAFVINRARMHRSANPSTG